MESYVEMRMINIGQRSFQITDQAAQKLVEDGVLRVCDKLGCDLHLAAYLATTSTKDKIGALMAAGIDGALLQLSADIATAALEERDLPKRREEKKMESPADVLRAAIRRANDKQHEVMHASGKEAAGAIKEAMDEARARGVPSGDTEKILAEVMFGDLGAMISAANRGASNGGG